jgi:phosphate transport system protein
MLEVTPSVVSRLEELQQRVFDLGGMVETAISRSIEALTRRDTLLAQAVIRQDAEIDQTEVAVQELCVAILEHERLVGIDLRTLVAILKINDSLERIADHAQNVVEVVVEVGDWERFRRVNGTNEIAEKSRLMVVRALDALRNRDTFLARQVIRADDEIDALQARILQRIEHEVDRIPEYANPLMKLEYVTRQFERIGDVATNIAEEVIYVVDGQIVRHL